MNFSKFHFNTNSRATNIIKDKICESCNIKKLENKHICGMCNTIRSVRPSDYIRNKLNFFSVFSFKDDYKIDKKKLDIQYKDLQKVLHPDKYAHESDDIIKEAGDCSSYISNAYQTLKDDYNRGNYLLKMKGFSGIDEDFKISHDKQFLQTLMALQERIEDSESKEELEQIRSEILEIIIKGKKQVEILFDGSEFNKVTEMLNFIKFYSNVLDQVNSKL